MDTITQGAEMTDDKSATKSAYACVLILFLELGAPALVVWICAKILDILFPEFRVR